MKPRALLLFLIAMSMSAAAAAADSGRRTYADPACSERDANPDKCVLPTGSSRRGDVDNPTPASPKPSTPGAAAPGALTPVGTPTPIGGGFTPKAAKK